MPASWLCLFQGTEDGACGTLVAAALGNKESVVIVAIVVVGGRINLDLRCARLPPTSTKGEEGRDPNPHVF